MPSSVRKHVPQPTWKTGFARSASESAHPELWDGLVGAWSPGLGNTGDTLFDITGNGNNGQLTNMQPVDDWEISSGRGALNFDAARTAPVVELPDNTPQPAHISFGLWINKTGIGDSTNPHILRSGDGNGNVFIIQRGSDDKPWFRFNAAAEKNIIGPDVIPSGWTHYMGTYDGDIGILYENGIQIGSDSSTSGDLNYESFTGWNIGANSSAFDEVFHGHVDDIFIYDRALSPLAIKKLYSLGRGGIFEPKQVEYYLAPSATLDQTRMSTFNIGMPWRSGSMVNPLDTGFTAANRQASGFMYAGIIAQAPSGATLPPLLEGNMLIGGFQNMSGGL